MIEVFKYQVLDADGNLREMPDMVTLGRIAELDAIIVLGSELKVPQSDFGDVDVGCGTGRNMSLRSG